MNHYCGCVLCDCVLVQGAVILRHGPSTGLHCKEPPLPPPPPQCHHPQVRAQVQHATLYLAAGVTGPAVRSGATSSTAGCAAAPAPTPTWSARSPRYWASGRCCRLYRVHSLRFRWYALNDKQFKMTHINLNFQYYYEGFEEAD